MEPADLVGHSVREYHFLSLLGRGGMGAVLLAWHTKLRQHRAVKIFRADAAISMESAGWFKARLAREARLACHLNHPHLVRVHDYFEEQDCAFLVMEYVPGETLTQRIRRRGRLLPLGDSLSALVQACDGLSAAHALKEPGGTQMGLVHRDLSPDNLMITVDHLDRGILKVIDFGIARPARRERSAQIDPYTITVSGAFVGKIQYASPEQLASQDLDARSDVYSLGMVAYFLFTGKVPLLGENFASTLFLRVQNDPPALSAIVEGDFPVELDEVFLRAIARKPEDRYPDMDEFQRAIERCGLPIPVFLEAPPRAQLPEPPKEGTAGTDEMDHGANDLRELDIATNLVQIAHEAPVSTRTDARTPITPVNQPTRSLPPAWEIGRHLEETADLLIGPSNSNFTRNLLIFCGGLILIIAAGIALFRPEWLQQAYDRIQPASSPQSELHQTLLPDGPTPAAAVIHAPPTVTSALPVIPPAVAPSPLPAAVPPATAEPSPAQAVVATTTAVGPLRAPTEAVKRTPTSSPTRLPSPTPTPTPTPTTTPTPTAQPTLLQLKLRMARIEAGTFLMGSPPSETCRETDEVQHQVTITAPFLMAVTEITQTQYAAVTGNNPALFQDKGRDYPVEQVTWRDAVNFCNLLSEREGLTPCYRPQGETVVWDHSADGYRLPTEAEWEYACRAGSAGTFHTGDATDGCARDSVSSALEQAGWYWANSGEVTHAVAQKKPNTWGLYDMHGNVWEWCWDWWAPYPRGNTADPRGPMAGRDRVMRGGAGNAGPDQCRAAYRAPTSPGREYGFIGFRPVRGAKTGS